jgi:hypothetical protein
MNSHPMGFFDCGIVRRGQEEIRGASHPHALVGVSPAVQDRELKLKQLNKASQRAQERSSDYVWVLLLLG